MEFVILAVILLIALGIVIGICVTQGKKKGKKSENIYVNPQPVRPVAPSPTVPENTDTQKKELLKLKKQMWEIQESEPYRKIFDAMAMPLQMLMGLPGALSRKDPAWIEYYLNDGIIEVLTDVRKSRGGSYSQGKLIFPVKMKAFDDSAAVREINQMSLQDLKSETASFSARIGSGNIVLQEKGIVEDLGDILENLEKLYGSKEISEAFLSQMASDVRKIFEAHGIYPRFADELTDPHLKIRFNEAQDSMIKYPGLFILRNRKLELLGSYVGLK